MYYFSSYRLIERETKRNYAILSANMTDLPGDLPGAAAPVPEEDLQNQVRPVGPGGPVSP